MRTSIKTCYERTLNRWKSIMDNNYSEDEYVRYADRKKGMFNWYKGINKFLENINKL